MGSGRESDVVQLVIILASHSETPGLIGGIGTHIHFCVYFDLFLTAFLKFCRDCCILE